MAEKGLLDPGIASAIALIIVSVCGIEERLWHGPGKDGVMFGRMVVTPILQLGRDADLQTSTASLLSTYTHIDKKSAVNDCARRYPAARREVFLSRDFESLTPNR